MNFKILMIKSPVVNDGAKKKAKAGHMGGYRCGSRESWQPLAPNIIARCGAAFIKGGSNNGRLK